MEPPPTAPAPALEPLAMEPHRGQDARASGRRRWAVAGALLFHMGMVGVLGRISSSAPLAAPEELTVKIRSVQFESSHTDDPLLEMSKARMLTVPEPLPIETSPPPQFVGVEDVELKPLEANGLGDDEEGGTRLDHRAATPGGGGGDGAPSLEFGHQGSFADYFSKIKKKEAPSEKSLVKSPAESAEAAPGTGTDASGKLAGAVAMGNTHIQTTGSGVPGTLALKGAGQGLGNGTGSGATGSQGSGTGSGAGLNGAGIGNGAGKAKPLGVSRAASALRVDGGGYPSSARRAHHEGTVTVRVEILTDGSVGQIELQGSSGYSELDSAALSAARGWRFSPEVANGLPVVSWAAVPYSYVLR